MAEQDTKFADLIIRLPQAAHNSPLSEAELPRDSIKLFPGSPNPQKQVAQQVAGGGALGSGEMMLLNQLASAVNKTGQANTDSSSSTGAMGAVDPLRGGSPLNPNRGLGESSPAKATSPTRPFSVPSISPVPAAKPDLSTPVSRVGALSDLELRALQVGQSAFVALVSVPSRSESASPKKFEELMPATQADLLWRALVASGYVMLPSAARHSLEIPEVQSGGVTAVASVAGGGISGGFSGSGGQGQHDRPKSEHLKQAEDFGSAVRKILGADGDPAFAWTVCDVICKPENAQHPAAHLRTALQSELEKVGGNKAPDPVKLAIQAAAARSTLDIKA